MPDVHSAVNRSPSSLKRAAAAPPQAKDDWKTFSDRELQVQWSQTDITGSVIEAQEAKQAALEREVGHLREENKSLHEKVLKYERDSVQQLSSLKQQLEVCPVFPCCSRTLPALI